MDHLVSMGLLEQLELRVPQEYLVEREKLVILARKDPLDLLVSQESQDCKAPRGEMAGLVLLDLRDHKGIKAILDLLAHRDLLVLMVNMVIEDLLGQKEKKESLEVRVDLDLVDHQEWKDPRETQGLQDFLVHLENKVLMV